MRAPKILLVDASSLALVRVRKLLKPAGCELTYARGGLEALRLAPGEQPDLILMDAAMPGLDGIETCRRLRLGRETRTIPVVLFGSAAQLARKKEGYDAGCDDFLAGPLDRDELLAAIRYHLDAPRLHSA
ncbi:MAG: response regulator [Deltaproteobacteria bacterium]|nr:response regulator [Deltaproteobacteria bacterium]